MIMKTSYFFFGITCTSESFTRMCIKKVNVGKFDTALKLLNKPIGWKFKLRETIIDKAMKLFQFEKSG